MSTNFQAPALIAVDWGSTHRRLFVVDSHGRIAAVRRDSKGLRSAPGIDFAGEIRAFRAEFGDLPIICAGMVGSVGGWVNVPYLGCPANITDLTMALQWVERGRTAIVPGLSDPAGDVMRGEEVQVFGARAAGMVEADAVLCQPGTHCKWVRLVDSRVAGFSTAMTGELFALLKTHSLLADFLTGAVCDDAPFREGVARGLQGRLSRDLFGVRAQALLGLRAPEDCAAFASGLLIGHDVAGEGLAPGQVVHILADGNLGPLYASAVSMAGGQPRLLDSDAAFVAGIVAIWKESA